MAKKHQHGQSQSFQPEWMATTPPVKRTNSTRLNPAVSIMLAKTSGGGNRRIDFDEITIGRAVAGDDLAQRGDRRLAIECIEPVEHRQIDLREFETEEPRAAFQHATRLG